jgi:hypothetical protein
MWSIDRAMWSIDREMWAIDGEMWSIDRARIGRSDRRERHVRLGDYSKDVAC